MVWRDLPNMPRPRSSCSAVEWGTNLVVTGGGINEIDIFSVTTGIWSTLDSTGSLNRKFCSALVFDTKLLIVGGVDEEGCPCDTQQFSVEANSWEEAPGWGKFGSCLSVAC